MMQRYGLAVYAARLLRSTTTVTRRRNVKQWLVVSNAERQHEGASLLAPVVFLGLVAVTSCSAPTSTSNDQDKPSLTHKPTIPPPESDPAKDLFVCGQWCALSKKSRCTMDTSIVPCQEDWCKTTCELWDLFVLGGDEKHRPVTCAMYAAGTAYPRGATVCDAACLITEVSPKRYPAPTGLGILCRPETCSPAACPWTGGPALGTLQCPCNWFGSECHDDWIPVTTVEKKKQEYGVLQHVTLHVSPESYKTILQDYKPGGVIRITHRDENGIPREMACALAPSPIEGELQILLAPTDTSLRPQVREVADRLRNLPSGTTTTVDNLYVNPSISGFFNSNYTYLMNYLEANPSVKRMVIVASGAGLGAALTAAQAAIKHHEKHEGSLDAIFMYYGLRDLHHLPFRDELEKLMSSIDYFQLTLVLSGESFQQESIAESSKDLQAAVQRGQNAKTLVPSNAMKAFVSPGSPTYTQHVVGLDLTSGEGSLREASLDDAVFVICGRIEILDDTLAILKHLCGDNDLASERVFTNI